MIFLPRFHHFILKLSTDTPPKKGPSDICDMVDAALEEFSPFFDGLIRGRRLSDTYVPNSGTPCLLLSTLRSPPAKLKQLVNDVFRPHQNA